jgi:hypothetical protein
MKKIISFICLINKKIVYLQQLFIFRVCLLVRGGHSLKPHQTTAHNVSKFRIAPDRHKKSVQTLPVCTLCVNEAAGFIYTAAEAASQSAGLNMNNPQ